VGINAVVLIPYIDERIYLARDKRMCVFHPHVEHVVKRDANMFFSLRYTYGDGQRSEATAIPHQPAVPFQGWHEVLQTRHRP